MYLYKDEFIVGVGGGSGSRYFFKVSTCVREIIIFDQQFLTLSSIICHSLNRKPVLEELAQK